MERILGLELLRISTMVRRELDSQTGADQLHKATGGNGWILAYLARNEDRDVYQKDIEEHFSTTRSTVSKVVKLMEEKGFIRRLAVPGDARLKKLVLTEQGRAVYALAQANNERMEARLARGFSEAELAQLMGYLLRLQDNLKG